MQAVSNNRRKGVATKILPRLSESGEYTKQEEIFMNMTINPR